MNNFALRLSWRSRSRAVVPRCFVRLAMPVHARRCCQSACDALIFRRCRARLGLTGLSLVWRQGDLLRLMLWLVWMPRYHVPAMRVHDHAIVYVFYASLRLLLLWS